MSGFRAHTGLSTCRCIQCDLIRCGAMDADWDGWRDVEFAGEARVAMMRLTWREPVCYVGLRTPWAGCMPWFSRLGMALNFDDAEGADDEPA